MSSKEYKNRIPKCHPIESVAYYTDSGENAGCLKALFVFMFNRQRIVLRSNNPVWLPRTDQPETFSCPIRLFGKCAAGLFPCIPEPIDINIVDTSDVDELLNKIGS